MKLKIAAAITSAIVFFCMAMILLFGILSRQAPESGSSQKIVMSGQVSIAVSPTTTYKNGYATITWAASDNTTSCEASGEWNGPKTKMGQESTGRLTSVGKKEYNITCKNSNGQYQAKTTLTVTE